MKAISGLGAVTGMMLLILAAVGCSGRDSDKEIALRTCDEVRDATGDFVALTEDDTLRALGPVRLALVSGARPRMAPDSKVVA